MFFCDIIIMLVNIMKNLDFLKDKKIAHRGLFDNVKVPENSVEAFLNAIKNNYIIELDLHLTNDNKVVVFHDDNLKRMTVINKKIKDVNYDEIKDIKLLNTNSKIPLFADVLKLVNGRVPLIIELKTDNRIGKLENEVVKLLDNYNGLFVIKSFNPFIVNWFRIHRSNYIRGLLINKKLNDIMKYIYIFICKPDFLSCHYAILKNKIIRKYKNNNIVLGWGITNQKIDDDLADNLIYKITRFK